MLCSDVACPEIETLFFFVYYISHFKNGFVKYIFQKAMPTGKLAKWKMLLSEFDIVYVTKNVIKTQALADYLTENPINE